MTDREDHVSERLLTDSPAQRTAILISTMFASSLPTVNITVVNVVLPQMRGDLSAGIEEISWALTATLIAMAISMPTAGWITNRFGGRQSVLAMTLAFTVSTGMLGPATTLEEVIFWRFCQGLFGGLIPSLSMVIVLNSYPQRQHARALALWAGGIMIGPVVGPVLGGYLSEIHSWRLAFLFMVPWGVIAYLTLLAVIPATSKQANLRLDWLGFLTLAIALASAQLMLDRGNRLDWFESHEIVIWAVIFGFAFYLFVAHSITTRQPFIDLRIFADRNFVIGTAFMFVNGAITFASLMLLPTLLGDLRDVPAETIGILLTPRSFGFIFGTYVLGRLIRFMDPRLMLALGYVVNAWAFWYMAQFNLTVGTTEVFIAGFLLGLGEGIAWTPLVTITFSSLTQELRSYAVAMFHSARFFASGVGISLVVVVLTRSMQTNRAELNESLSHFSENAEFSGISALWSLDHLGGLAALESELVRQATMISYVNDFWVLMFASLLVMPLALLAKPIWKRPA